MTSHSSRHLRLIADTKSAPAAVLTIDCADCSMQHTTVCRDCLVTYLVNHTESEPVRFDADELQAVELLAEAGLVPSSKFSSRHGVA